MDENIIKKCTVVRHKLHQMAEPSNKEIETKKFCDRIPWKKTLVWKYTMKESGFMLYTERKKKDQVLHLEVKLMQCL